MVNTCPILLSGFTLFFFLPTILGTDTSFKPKAIGSRWRAKKSIFSNHFTGMQTSATPSLATLVVLDTLESLGLHEVAVAHVNCQNVPSNMPRTHWPDQNRVGCYTWARAKPEIMTKKGTDSRSENVVQDSKELLRALKRSTELAAEGSFWKVDENHWRSKELYPDGLLMTDPMLTDRYCLLAAYYFNIDSLPESAIWSERMKIGFKGVFIPKDVLVQVWKEPMGGAGVNVVKRYLDQAKAYAPHERLYIQQETPREGESSEYGRITLVNYEINKAVTD